MYLGLLFVFVCPRLNYQAPEMVDERDGQGPDVCLAVVFARLYFRGSVSQGATVGHSVVRIQEPGKAHVRNLPLLVLGV